jgi:hypothetical protein
MRHARFHVMIDQVRTTVTVAPVLCELLALKLGAVPQTPAARAALRAWLQAEIDRDPGAVRYGRASQRLAHQAMLHIAAPSLLSRRDHWLEQRLG